MYKSFDTRDDYSREDVEDYFNYMGMLASEVREAEAVAVAGP